MEKIKVDYFIANLKEVIKMVSSLTNEEYSHHFNEISASIGQHVRHLVEFYLCLVNSLKDGVVCYDDRARNLRMETDRKYIMEVMEKLTGKITLLEKDQPLRVRSNFSIKPDEFQTHHSSLSRELAYCLEHSIHHMAIIKIGINLLSGKISLSKNFGVAPDTIRYRSRSCAQ